MGNTIGVADVTATGSIVIDQVQLELNTSVPSSPIPTTTVAVTRATEEAALDYDLTGNYSNDAGSMIATFTPLNDYIVGSDDALVALDASPFNLLYRQLGVFKSSDGTDSANTV